MRSDKAEHAIILCAVLLLIGGISCLSLISYRIMPYQVHASQLAVNKKLCY